MVPRTSPSFARRSMSSRRRRRRVDFRTVPAAILISRRVIAEARPGSGIEASLAYGYAARTWGPTLERVSVAQPLTRSSDMRIVMARIVSGSDRWSASARFQRLIATIGRHGGCGARGTGRGTRDACENRTSNWPLPPSTLTTIAVDSDSCQCRSREWGVRSWASARRLAAEASHPRWRAQTREASGELTASRELPELRAVMGRRETYRAGLTSLGTRVEDTPQAQMAQTPQRTTKRGNAVFKKSVPVLSSAVSALCQRDQRSPQAMRRRDISPKAGRADPSVVSLGLDSSG